MRTINRLLCTIMITITGTTALAVSAAPKVATKAPAPSEHTTNNLVPPAPNLNASAYVLMDANSGQILAQKNMNTQYQPASLTKLMTLYLTFQAVQHGTVTLNSSVPISKKAWRTGGSKMFVKVGTHVPVQKLIEGIIVDSGNDASVALAEYIGGTEQGFVTMMNQEAKMLGMTQTHFMDATGLPHPNHLTTAHDLSLLARATIENFPQEYKFFSQKWLTYSGIKQPNRNRLLWRYPGADGLKTGHTAEAGYCLIGSALKNGQRLITVVMGTPSDEARASDSIALMQYGFRFFKTEQLFKANTAIAHERIWYGDNRTVSVGSKQGIYVTIPRGETGHVKTNIQLSKNLSAPIKQGQAIGTLTVTLNGKTLLTKPLLALEADPIGGTFRRSTDKVEHWFENRHHKNKTSP